MSTSTVTTNSTPTGQRTVSPAPRWQATLFWLVPLALLLIAILMRLYHLGAPFDRDGYDEGVYWQSLRSMATGHALYQQIFSSQPPFFLFSIYPFFVLLGSTLWSARFGIAVVSLFGFLGAFLLGQAVNKRIGGIVAMLLLLCEPLYFTQSQKIEAEAPAAAFSLLAVGAIYLWWDNPDTPAGLCLAALSGVALVLGTLSKLFSISSIVPIGLLLLARLWQISHHRAGTNRRSLLPILVLILASLLTALLVLLPFVGTYSALYQQVVTFHTTASAALSSDRVYNKALIENFLQANLLLVIAALYGLLVALLRRDWRVLPLLGWSLITLYLLWQQVPLFPRHFVALTPALICLAVFGVAGGIPFKGSILSLLLILTTVALELPQYPPYYTTAVQRSHDGYATLEMRVAQDIDKALAPDQDMITDGQFVAALANRNTPPDLVDTSMVRITSGYLTAQQLIADAAQPRVGAVLFFTNRLNLPQLAAFSAWVRQHFHLKIKYGNGEELWVR